MTANYVPAAAVKHRSQALSGFIGRKGSVGGEADPLLKAFAQQMCAMEISSLELIKGYWNSMCSGGMRRYIEEHQRLRRVPGI